MKIKDKIIEQQNNPIEAMEQNRKQLMYLMDKVLGTTNKLFKKYGK